MAELSRQELYSQVWAEPMIKVAQKYGISDVGLAKICRRNNVPVPPRGHWARKHAGYKVEIIPLPRQNKDFKITINPPPVTNKVSLPAERSKAREAIQKKLTVPETLQDPHLFVAKTATVLSKRKPGENVHIQAGSASVLNIKVSPEQLDRALRILDAVIKGIESQGLEILISDSGTSVMVEEIQVFFSLTEELEAKPREPTKWERDIGRTEVYTYVPSGNLLLSIDQPEVTGARKNWRDGKKPLESNLAHFVVRLIEYGALAKKQEEERQERQRRWEEQRRQEAERQRRAWEEKEKFSKLMTIIQNWQQSEQIRQFADAVEKKLRENPDFTVDEEWLAWVRKQADRIDPLLPKPAPDER
jgi:hypothetical protein